MLVALTKHLNGRGHSCQSPGTTHWYSIGMTNSNLHAISYCEDAPGGMVKLMSLFAEGENPKELLKRFVSGDVDRAGAREVGRVHVTHAPTHLNAPEIRPAGESDHYRMRVNLTAISRAIARAAEALLVLHRGDGEVERWTPILVAEAQAVIAAPTRALYRWAPGPQIEMVLGIHNIGRTYHHPMNYNPDLTGFELDQKNRVARQLAGLAQRVVTEAA